MQMRYRYMTCRYRKGSQRQLEQRYRQLLSDVLRQSQLAMGHQSVVWRPLADILESAEMIRVKIELAGMDEKDIEVTLYEDALVVTGARRDDREYDEGLSYQEAQIRYGPFRVEIFIPHPIERDAVNALYENGMLSVDLPKKLASNQFERVHVPRPATKE